MGCAEVNAILKARVEACRSKGPKNNSKNCKGLLKSIKNLKCRSAMSEPAVSNGEPDMVNKYPDGTVASRGDVVLADDGGRYVLINPTYSDGFALLAHIENPVHFTRKAPIGRCQKQTPDEVESQCVADVLARIDAARKRTRKTEA